MEKIVSIDEMVILIKDQLNHGGEVAFTPKGNSMLPLLRNNRDKVILKVAGQRLKKYQIAFYQRKNGEYVLHRVIKVCSDSYVMRGDHQFAKEYGVTDEQIIAVVKSFMRNGKTYDDSNILYHIYCVYWVYSAKLRYKIYRVRSFLGKYKRKILRKET